MLKVIILENDDYQADYTERLVSQRKLINATPNSYDIELYLRTNDPQEVIDSIKDEAYLAILDIELDNQLSGIDVAEQIRKKAEFAEIIFVTAYQEYLPYTVSRRIEPFDYISKGKQIESIADRLRIDIDEAYARYQNYVSSNQKHHEKITYEPIRGVKRQVDLENLYYIESVKNTNRRLRIVGKDIRIEYHGELNQVDSNHLLKVNQSTLINPKAIQEFNRKERIVYFDTNREIKVTVSYRKIKSLVDFLEKENH
ncbi:LytR/AlgR family response regulator transcription factor [Limosilactobacillus reuteri]|uniref:Response regulator n=2 Tax=Limosilactobacillus reuteri TaxID=1598 RepID=A0A256VL90_LIMRT|nr:LytTR family DNA-binding domain-containing protein [Limosilactobacillus reuteri]EDX43379.1 two component transcriptional regulator, LytTR family [Limosilactobacillus reuteri subsp. rodentium]MCC4372406.1 LytTR family DNA-binding domain-containing protein [Limosilactobacillus reuteri]MCC4475848.1 LytTR family DNA-binding domain-containing protein [Limosilactobacillus reuteri]MCR1878474.1 LytTR family DNA-binding domain-containing protein [Limosilactobacillus reuteri]MRG89003.1 response regul